jgi:hypothetical protein
LKGHAQRSPEERSQAVRKGLAKRTPEQLREAGFKAAATRKRNREAKKNEGQASGS